MRRRGKSRSILYGFVFVFLMAISLLMTIVCYSEATVWDCPECGRTGNTGNYCGGCAHPAPWIETKMDLAQDFKTIGNIVTFGRYEQDNNMGNGAEEIEWIVLGNDKANHKKLLISRYGLDVKPYNNESANVTWEICAIRNWLNQDFLNSAFSPIERDAIILSKVDNSFNQGYKDCASGGNDTQDKIFLLSCAEVTLHLHNKEERRLALTAYAMARGAYTSNYGYQTVDGKAAGWWWLRSPGLTQCYAARVNCDGTINCRYNVNSTLVAVRPAFWLDLDSDFFKSGETN